MTQPKLRIVVIGLSLSSSWGNGHATTYRALLRALAERGHSILFLERDQPWYADHRDLPDPGYCKLRFYNETGELDGFRRDIAAADLVIVGSYVAEGVAVIRKIRPWTKRLAFYDIDTPITLTMLASGEQTYLSPAVIPLLDLYFSFTGGPTLDVLEQRYAARSAQALFCAVDPELYHPFQPLERHRWMLGYLGTYSADRQPRLERLLLEPARLAPDLRFVVAGSQYPDGVDWPENVERIEHLPPADHAEFYNSQSWTLNVTRDDMIAAGYSPSVRLFEASACATPIISDHWPGLTDFLEIGREIVVAETAMDVLAFLRSAEPERVAIGNAARQRVLNEHTAAHRAGVVEQAVADLQSRASKVAGLTHHFLGA